MSPLDQWTADSGVDSLSGSAMGTTNCAERTQAKSVESSSTVNVDPRLKENVVVVQSRNIAAQSSPPSKETNPNEVIIRLFINPSSDIFGFTLTQNGHKVIVESVDEGESVMELWQTLSNAPFHNVDLLYCVIVSHLTKCRSFCRWRRGFGGSEERR